MNARRESTASGALIALAAILAAGYGTRTAAQPGGGLIVDISACIEIKSARDRLACYDELARAARTGSSAAQVRGNAVETRSTDAGVPRPSDERDVAGAPAPTGARGIADDPTPAPAAAPAAAPAPAAAAAPADEILSEVAALREIVPGQLEITLTNGQVWRQTGSDRYRLRVGYPVRVYPTRFGESYRLTSEVLRGFVQVRRVH